MKLALTCLLLALAAGAWGQDVSTRANLIVPVPGASTFTPGPGVGAEIAWALPKSWGLPGNAWHVSGAVDADTLTLDGQQYYMTLLRPALSYDAFIGPTAFMTFEVDGGWMVADTPDLSTAANKPCVGGGTSFSFYLGPHVNLRTEFRYVEVIDTLRAITMSVGFNVIGN